MGRNSKGAIIGDRIEQGDSPERNLIGGGELSRGLNSSIIKKLDRNKIFEIRHHFY